MSEESKQSPHYIPELDPGRKGADSDLAFDLIFYLLYVISAIFASILFFSMDEMLLGFLMIGFGIGIVVLAYWLSNRHRWKRPNQKFKIGEEESSPEREQSPHYIPELDPNNPKHKKGFAPDVVWISLGGGLASFLGAFIASQFGIEKLMMFLIAAGIVLLSPILMFASWSTSGS